MKKLIQRFIREEDGQDLIEYALLAAIIALGCVVVLNNLRGGIQGVFTNVNTSLNTAS
jgi:pilus assembly protein Flp/PilA